MLCCCVLGSRLSRSSNHIRNLALFLLNQDLNPMAFKTGQKKEKNTHRHLIIFAFSSR